MDKSQINLILVAQGLRNAYFPKRTNNIKKLEITAVNLGVQFILTPLGEWVFVKNKDVAQRIGTTADLGRELGYFGWNHKNYWDDEVSRYGIDVIEVTTNSHILAEFCEASKVNKETIENYYKRKLDQWNQTFPQYKFDVSIVFVPARHKLLSTKSYSYFNKYRSTYINIIYNDWFLESKFETLVKNLTEENFDRDWNKIQIFLKTIAVLYPITEQLQGKTNQALVDLDNSLWNFLNL